MRVSTNNARVDKAGRHNDRNFNVDKADHIDKALIDKDRFWTWQGEEYMGYEQKEYKTFKEMELEYYEKNFSEYLKNQNEKHMASKHASRCKSMLQYYQSKNASPEDKILEIGEVDNHADPEVLWEAAKRYRDAFMEEFGDKCEILSMALHVDEPEAGPHVHIRRVWKAKDDDGTVRVSQSRALDEMGIERPNPLKPSSRTNNPQVAFTELDRAIFINECLELGLDIETERISKARKKSKLDYEIYTREIKSKELEKQTIELEEQAIKAAALEGSSSELGSYYKDKYLTSEKKRKEEREKMISFADKYGLRNECREYLSFEEVDMDKDDLDIEKLS